MHHRLTFLYRWNQVIASMYTSTTNVSELSMKPSSLMVALLNRSAGYWAFLDFALAIIPVDIIWKLQLSRKKKVGLSLLLSAGILSVSFVSNEEAQPLLMSGKCRDMRSCENVKDPYHSARTD